MLKAREGFGGAEGGKGVVTSCGTPDDSGSGGFGGAQRQHTPACLKKTKQNQKIFIAVRTALVIRRGWLQGSTQLPQASTGRRHKSWNPPPRALGWGDGDAQPTPP